METTNHFIGGVAFLFIATFIIGLIGNKKELGFCRAGFTLNITPGVYYANHITTAKGDYMHIGNETYGNHSIIKIDKPTTITFIFDMYEECDIIFNSIEFVNKSQRLFRIK